MTTQTQPDAVTEFNDALGSVRRAIARGAMEIAKLSYYPTLKRRLVALECADPTVKQWIQACRIVQDIEVQLFGEVFTYTPDAYRQERAGAVICWTCGKALPTWQVEFGYKQCEDCQIKAEKQAELDNAAVKEN